MGQGRAASGRVDARRSRRVSHAHRARAVAEAATRAAADRGVTLPVDLRLWQLVDEIPTGAPLPPVPPDGAGGDVVDQLAAVLEAVTPPTRRRATGLHVTPSWLADRVVALAVDDLAAPDRPLTVCDPACGGGAFLLAAARALEARGIDRRTVVRHHLWGADVDPVGLAAAEAALAVWAGTAPPPGRLVVGDTLARPAGTPWPDRPGEGFDLVVGNPPFLNQLGSATVRSSRLTERLRKRFGEAVQPYTDTAWLFLLAACEMTRAGGRVAMVQPLSLGAARDAAAVRSALDQRAELRELWVDDGRSFAAAVQVCAPVLTVRSGHSSSCQDARSSAQNGMGAQNGWAARLADATGVPVPVMPEDGATVGEWAKVQAGFREEYYGLVPLVAEADEVGPEARCHPLVTAGVLDWGRSAWGQRASRFAKRSWTAPVVDLARRDDPAVDAALPPGCRRWLAHTSRPKVVVATQTRVVELAVDADGCWVASVPTVVVVPHDVDDLWLLAAAMASPSATAWLARRAPGVALTRHALKVSARDLSALPLPVDRPAWDEAAGHMRSYVTDPSDASFEAYVDCATAAYAAPASLVDWWRSRLRR